MRRESLIPFLPAALAAVTDVRVTGFVLTHQPLYGRTIVFLIVMFGAALLAAVRNKWVRFVGFVIVLAGVYISGMSVGMFYLPTFFAFVWVMVRNVRPPVQSGPGN